MAPRRYSSPLRAVAAAAALAVVTAGGGLPMCMSLLAQAAAPCTMHAKHGETAAHHVHSTTLSAAPSSDMSCHADPQSPGCATGGTCPAGATAAPASSARTLGVAAPDHRTAFAVQSAHPSFVTPPLSPPPQA